MRRRLTAAIAGVAALAMILFALPLALLLARTYRDEDLLRLQRDTVAATREIDLSKQRRDAVELPRTIDRLTGCRSAEQHDVDRVRGKLARCRVGAVGEVDRVAVGVELVCEELASPLVGGRDEASR